MYERDSNIEGAAQRVQEDKIKFSRIMESLGTSLIESIIVLIQFIPRLVGLSVGIPIFFFGDWQYGLITGALIWTLGGTIFLIALGWILRLVGVEYDLQKKEAAYRKLLVIAEDDGNIRPKKIEELFDDVRSIHFLSYLRYLYFLYQIHSLYLPKKCYRISLDSHSSKSFFCFFDNFTLFSRSGLLK